MSSNTASGQRPEALAFIERIQQVPLDGALDDALQPSLEFEAQLRQIWATDKDNARLQDPYVGLVDVFATPDALRVTHAREVKALVEDDETKDKQDNDNEEDMNDLEAKYIMPLKDTQRRKTGELCMVKDMEEFITHFKIFTGQSQHHSTLTLLVMY
jgi:hypothetical protein